MNDLSTIAWQVQVYHDLSLNAVKGDIIHLHENEISAVNGHTYIHKRLENPEVKLLRYQFSKKEHGTFLSSSIWILWITPVP